MIVPDVNLLLYAYFDEFRQHHAARQWWEDVVNGSESVGVPWAVTVGFVRVSTRPKELSNPITALQAIAIEHDAEVHTNDRDFSRFPGLRWRNPIDETA